MEKNAFDRTIEIFAKQGADTIILENYRDGVVTGTPYNSVTGEHWAGMSMISSMEEALKCKYKKACHKEEKEIVAFLDAQPATEKE